MSGKVDLDRWAPHLLAAKREGKSLTRYARSRGLSRHTLYAARQMLRGKPGTRRRPGAPRRMTQLAPSAFAAVRLVTPSVAVSGSAPRLQARLPNGVALELSCGGADAALLMAMIRALAGR